FPVSRTFSALMTITKSPVSTCGVKTVLSLPRSRFAAFTATFPSTWSWASMTHHLCGFSLVLAENVFIGKKSTEITGDASRCQPMEAHGTYESHVTYVFHCRKARWRF